MENAWEKAAGMLKEGKIVAVKGLGGYHLACLASSGPAVQKLRRLKKRDQKPFAMMGTLEMIKQNAYPANLKNPTVRKGNLVGWEKMR